MRTSEALKTTEEERKEETGRKELKVGSVGGNSVENGVQTILFVANAPFHKNNA